MPRQTQYDAVIIGSGPNGLSAGIVLAQAGCSVLILEADQTYGGGVRSAELTLPGFIHDPCAAVLPLSLASPFFRSLPLEKFGLEWIHPSLILAHPFDNDEAVLLERSLECTAEHLGRDGSAYYRLMKPLLSDWDAFSRDLLGPLPLPPRSPLSMIRFGARALLPALMLDRLLFREKAARALFAGLAGHAMLPLEHLGTGAYGIVLGLLAHAVGWPIPKGGAGSLSHSLAAYFQSLGGEIVTSFPVSSLDDLPDYRVALFDLAPRGFLQILGDRLPGGYAGTLKRYRYGPGVCKVDFALSSQVPWKVPRLLESGTLHLGGSMEEIAESESQVARGIHPQKPYVLVSQPSLFDSSRAPAGMHTLWAYCHVPNGSSQDVSAAIEAQIERYAPGFQQIVLARSVRTARDMEAYNPNYVGGDINAGVQDLFQLYTRPAPRLNPYTTPLKRIFLCSSATPPGGGVHGMCGYYAAQAALRQL